MTRAIIVKREGHYIVTAQGAGLYASLLAQTKAAAATVDGVLTDPGFQAVSADLSGPNKIGTVADNIDAVGEAADNMAAIVAAHQAASDVLAAAAAIMPQAPSYANPGGMGDRTATVSVTSAGFTASGGVPANLVNGVASSDATNAFRLPASTSVIGMAINFDFGPGSRKVINEITVKFQSTQGLGTWRMRASNDGVNWTNIGGTFMMASATTQVISTLSANVIGYRYYQLLGDSGSTSGTLNYIQEVEFKIAVTAGDGIVAMPNGGTAGQSLEKISPIDGAAVWVDPKEPPGRSLLSNLWLIDEGHGTILRDQIGQAHFTLTPTANRCDIGSGGSIAWVNGELVLTNASLSTDATVNGRALFIVYDAPVDLNLYALTHVTNNQLFNTNLRITTHATKLKMLHGLGINDPAVNGNMGMIGFNNGGTSAAACIRASNATGSIILGATRNTDWAGRIVTPWRPLLVAAMSTDPTIDDLKALQDFFDYHMDKRGRTLTGKRAKRRASVALFNGESTNHTSLVMDAEPLLTQAMRQDPLNIPITAVMGASASGVLPTIQNLTYWRDETWSGYQLGNEGKTRDNNVAEHDRNRKMGPAYGFALRHRYAPTPRETQMFIFKSAQGGTLLAPFGSALAAGGTLALNNTFDAGATTGATLFTAVQCQGWGKFEAELRRQGYGIDYIYQYVARGINDANQLANGVIANAATWQGWRQTEHDRFKAFVGVTTLPTTTLVPHLPIPGAAETYAAQCGQPGVTGYANDAAGQAQLDRLLLIRAGERQFGAANAADVKVREGDAYGTNIANGDSVHMPFTGLRQYGIDLRLDFSFAAPVAQAYVL